MRQLYLGCAAGEEDDAEEGESLTVEGVDEARELLMDSRRCNLGWVLWRLANSRGLHKDASLDDILEQRRLYYEQKRFAARNGIPVESLAGVEDQDLTSRLKVYFEVKADVAQWEAEMVLFALENVETALMREESPWTDWRQCLAAHEWCVWRLEGLEPDVELGDADDPL
jgi:hypothetical protein